MTQKFIMLAGPSGSGKSTYAKKLRSAMLQDGERSAVISSDEIRWMLYGDASDQTDHQQVFDVARKDIEHFLARGTGVIFDATNLVAKFRAESLCLARNLRIPCELHYMTIDGVTCMERIYRRERKVPELTLNRQLNQRQRDMERGLHEFYDEGFRTVKFID